MCKLILIFSILILPSASAYNLEVGSKHLSYKLKKNNETIFLKGYLLNMKMSRKECNKRILNKFENRLDFFSKNLRKGKSEIKTIRVKYNGEDFNVSNKSKLGRAFLALPKEFQRMKIEEKFSCEKKGK